jgi:ribosomal protein L19E
MARTNRYKPKQVIDALHECKGMVSLAAKRLGCDTQTIYNYATRFPAVQEARENSVVELLDAAELTMWNAIQRGDTGAAMFVLRYLGKDRGYVERREEKVTATVQHEHIHVWKERLQAAHTALEARRSQQTIDHTDYRTLSPGGASADDAS